MKKILPYLSEALPVPGRALSLRTFFNQSLIDSLKYLLEVCEDVIPAENFSKAVQKISSLKADSKISGLLGALHADFIAAIETEDIKKANTITQRLATDDFQVENLRYIDISNLNDYYYPLVKDISSKEIIDEIVFFPLTPVEYEEVEKSIKKGFQVLPRICPDFFEESQELISEILILNAQGVKQGTSSDLFGTVYKSYQHKWQHLTDALECIIHEQSHLYVHLLTKDDPLVLNPSEMYESPLRKEKRPLMGIYHAAFVLARINHVLTRALALNEIPEDEKTYCQEMIDYYNKRFETGFEILNTHAQMTPLAKELLHSASKLVA